MTTAERHAAELDSLRRERDRVRKVLSALWDTLPNQWPPHSQGCVCDECEARVAVKKELAS